jgi:hypothetical protein
MISFPMTPRAVFGAIKDSRKKTEKKEKKVLKTS